MRRYNQNPGTIFMKKLTMRHRKARFGNKTILREGKQWKTLGNLPLCDIGDTTEKH
jgi:hypothetical protein